MIICFLIICHISSKDQSMQLLLLFNILKMLTSTMNVKPINSLFTDNTFSEGNNNKAHIGLEITDLANYSFHHP